MQNTLGSRSGVGLVRGPRQQRGIAVVVVTIGMVAMLAMAGLALDMGEVYINKTRLQNALDAAALSAAKELVLQPDNTVAATLKARETFVLNQDEGNEQLADIAQVEVQTEFSETLVPWTPNSGANFVRVWVDTFSLQSYLVSLVGIDDKPVVASATAGPAAGLCPNTFPLMACGWAAEDHENGGEENNWGYQDGDQVILKYHAGDCPEDPSEDNPDPCNGPGNFNIMDVGSGAAAVRAAICGDGNYDCIQQGDFVDTQPGNIVGPVGDAVNAMFADWHGAVTPENCPADDNTTQYFFDQGVPPFFDDYASVPNNGRRVVPIPVGRCIEDEAGKKEMEMLGTLCFLITQKATHEGITQLVHGEFLDVDEQACLARSHIAPDPDVGGGPVIIVLYKDQIMDDG